MSALWLLLLALGMLGVGYTVWSAQVDPASAFLIPYSWFLYCYILYFPSSPPAILVARGFDFLDDGRGLFLIQISAMLLLFYSIYRHSPFGMLYIVALGVMNSCKVQRLAYRAGANADTLGLPKPPQPDVAVAEVEDSCRNIPGTCQEASLASEQEQASKTEQSNRANPSDGTPGVGASKSQARGVMNTLWYFLRLILMLGLFAVMAKVLVDAFLKDWVVNTAPTDGFPVFEAEVIVANKTELPIQVPLAEFIPTSAFGSPCQGAPTPTPIAKSTQAWIGTAMSTPMPNPMPTPTPSATPDPEPVPIPIKPNDALNRLFDFDLPDPTPVLKWYFSLPTASQYTVIVISLLVLWCFSKPLIILAAHLAVLAIAYFVSAAVIALLLVYGFTAEQSIAIALPADFTLIGSLWYIVFWLKSLATASNSNDASLAELRCLLGTATKSNAANLSELLCLLQKSLKYIKWGMDDTTELIQRLQEVIDFVNSTITRVNEHEMKLTDHANEMNHLGKELDTKADLEQTTRILERLYEKIADLETSKGDAPLLREVQRKVDSLRRLTENIRKEKADATDLETVQNEVQRMVGLVDEMQKTKADHGALTELTQRLDGQAATVAGMLTSQDKLTKDVEELKTNMSIARAEVTTLSEASNRYDSSISNVENRAKQLERKSNDHNSQISKDRKNAKERMTKIEEENASLKQDVDKLQRHVTDMQNRMAAIEAGHGQHEENMQKLQHDVTDTNQTVTQLRSETDSQQDQLRDLEDSVDKRFQDSNEARAKLEKESKEAETVTRAGSRSMVKDLSDNIRKDFDPHVADVWNRFDGHLTKINAATGTASDALQRIEALESQLDVPIAQLGLDGCMQNKVKEYMDKFMVSDKFQAAFKDAQLILKKQSKLDHVRAEVRAYAEKRLESKDFQDQIYARFRELQAIDHNLSGDVPEVVSGGRASSPSFVPSTSSAASDNTTGNDDPLGDFPGVINRGRATLPGEMSSDNTTPTIPEESPIPDDVDDHHDSRSSPPGEPPGVNLGGRATNLAGSTSDDASNDDGIGSRPSGEDDDDTPGPEQREGKDARESDNLTGEQLHCSAIREQPGGEHDEETDEEKTDDEADDDADDNSDDDDSDDDDPSGPPSGSGGFHGRDGTGDDDDDDEDGDNGGAPRPFTGIGASRSAPGLGSSRYAASPTPDSNDSEGQSHVNGGGFEPQDDLSNCAEHQSEGDSKKGSPGQQWRRAKHQATNGIKSVRQAMNEAVMERQQQQEQNMPMQEQHHPTEARTRLSTARKSLKDSLRHLEKTQDLLKQAHDHQAELAHDQPESELPRPEEADGLRQEGHNLAEESRILQDALQGRGQSTRNQNASGQGKKARRGGRGGKGGAKNRAPKDETPSPDPQEAQGSLNGWQ